MGDASAVATQSDHQRTDLTRTTRSGRPEPDAGDPERCRDGSDEPDQRERPLEEEIGEREGIVLIKDGDGERDRGVVADEARSANAGGFVVLTEVEGRDGEGGEGHAPQRRRRDPGWRARQKGERHEQRR